MKRICTSCSFIFFLLSVFFIQSCSSDKTQNKSTGKAQTIRLGVNNFFFWRSNQNGQFTGAEVDIWNEIAKRNNFQISYVAMPENYTAWKEAMENDSLDAFVGMLKNPERETYMSFLEPPFRTKLRYITYVKNNSDIDINELEDMHGLKIAMIGGNYDLIAKDTLIEKKITSWDLSQAFDYLLKDSIDAVHAMQWLAESFLQDEKISSRIKEEPYSYSEYHASYLVMSKKSALTPKWEKVFGQTIRDMIEDGTMKEIIDSYVPGWYEVYVPGKGS